MWIVIARDAEPDAAYWPGRRSLAALDAVLWPVLWMAAVVAASPRAGLFGPVVVALAVVSLGGRLRRALLNNRRYRFTTWRWLRVLAVLAVMGVTLRLYVLARL